MGFFSAVGKLVVLNVALALAVYLFALSTRGGDQESIFIQTLDGLYLAARETSVRVHVLNMYMFFGVLHPYKYNSKHNITHTCTHAHIYIHKNAHIYIYIYLPVSISSFLSQSKVVDDIISNLYHDNALQGKRCLVTGGNRGLGKGISQLLHKLGCTTVVAARSTSQGVQLSPSVNASLIRLDLADFDSICHAAGHPLKPHQESNISLSVSSSLPYDIVILNAGIAPYRNIPTRQGFELALGTNCVGNMLFTLALWEQGLLKENSRVVIVVSETHRAVSPLDMSHILDPVQYGLSESMNFYARSKLCLVTIAQALSHKLAPHNISVHTICPGPVATDIARDAPAAVKWLVDAFMTAAFQTSLQAARPVVAIAATPAFAGPSGSHHHMYKMKPPRWDTLSKKRQDELLQTLGEAVKKHNPSCGVSME